MRIITKEQYSRICSDYKGIFSDYRRTQPWHKGRRMAFLPGEGAVLSLEGVHFLVDGDYSHLPILEKDNAREGCAYKSAGGYQIVIRVYRITEEQAEEWDLMYLDRVKTTTGDFALPGSDVYHRRKASDPGVDLPF